MNILPPSQLDLGLQEHEEEDLDNEEESIQACLDPHIHGERSAYSLCIICGRYAKDHSRFKHVDNPAAAEEKKKRMQNTMSKQSTKQFFSARLDRITLFNDPKQPIGTGHFDGGRFS
mgnify:CR=1 FL=1